MVPVFVMQQAKICFWNNRETGKLLTHVFYIIHHNIYISKYRVFGYMERAMASEIKNWIEFHEATISKYTNSCLYALLPSIASIYYTYQKRFRVVKPRLKFYFEVPYRNLLSSLCVAFRFSAPGGWLLHSYLPSSPLIRAADNKGDNSGGDDGCSDNKPAGNNKELNRLSLSALFVSAVWCLFVFYDRGSGSNSQVALTYINST